MARGSLSSVFSTARPAHIPVGPAGKDRLHVVKWLVNKYKENYSVKIYVKLHFQGL